jgi:hypothetical protein
VIEDLSEQTATEAGQHQHTDCAPKSHAPVFIIGCPRSGTTLLCRMLLAAGNFANYRAESDVFSVLRPAFGNLSSTRNLERLIDRWLRSRLFQVTGLNAKAIRERLISECRCEGDFSPYSNGTGGCASGGRALV